MRYTMLDVGVEDLASELLDEEPCEPTRVMTKEELEDILATARDAE